MTNFGGTPNTVLTQAPDN